ncbi:hypothetical protein NEOLEDRAFT_1170427 [Neolentinus lepideus HHB14362 ss-1]|uniref:Uncharacterized protein n=1 Tax=Neolentinus lepideus HHB14362 ss-1 TaxID=1314782 RepID=A0A165RJG3_9AGAM|nr:hypothetical protein NEOLEDRAFT_1170427 [Neolentinus lepideus HHB14362 ss-1]
MGSLRATGESSHAQAGDTEDHFNPYFGANIAAPSTQELTTSSETTGLLGYSPFLAAQTPVEHTRSTLAAAPTRTNTEQSTNGDNEVSESTLAVTPPAQYAGGKGKSGFAMQRGRIRAWWKKAWEWSRVHWFIMCLIAVILCLVISVPLGWALRLRPFEDAVASGNEMVELEASLISISSDKQSMTIDWNIYMSGYGCGNYTNTTMSLFFDENLLRSSSSSGSSPPNNNRPSTPVFVLNTAEACSSDTFANSPYFRTDIAIISAPGRTAQSYPFEKYTAEIFMFASLPDNVTFPQVGIVSTSGIAVGFKAELDANDSGAYDDGAYQSVLTITRGPVIRVYAIAIVIAIWLVTLTFLATCVAVVFLHRSMSATVLVLPIATLFAFTQLRSTLPGAPTGFGADIDFVGILPCLAIITFCAVLMTGVFLFGNPEKYDRENQSTQDKEKQD